MKVTQTIHPDDIDGEVCDAADHARAVVWGGATQNRFSVITENSLW